MSRVLPAGLARDVVPAGLSAADMAWRVSKRDDQEDGTTRTGKTNRQTWLGGVELPVVGSWHRQAACAQHPKVDFSKGGGKWGSARRKAICAACPVKAECLADALGTEDGPEDVHYVRGGCSKEDRTLMVRHRNDRAYWIYYGSNGSDLIKIGTTLDLDRRSYILGIDILAAERGGFRREAELHRRFAADRVHGEWFNRSPELIAHIESLTADREEAVA